MRRAHRRNRVPRGPDTVLDVPLGAPMSATLVQDRSQNANHGTILNTPIFRYPGMAVIKDAGEGVSAALLTTLSYPLTVLVWAKTPTTTNDDIPMIIEMVKKVDNSTRVRVRIHAPGVAQGFLRASNFDNVVNGQANSSVRGNDTVWHHSAGVFRDDSFRAVYVEGIFKMQNLTDITPLETSSNMADIDTYGIGVFAENDTSPGNGTLAGILVISKELSAAEILSHYNITRHKYGV